MTTYCKIKRITPSAQMPERGSRLAAGLDVRADLIDADGNRRMLKTSKTTQAPLVDIETGDPQNPVVPGFVLHPGRRVLVPTGLSMRTSPDIYVRVAPRSGLALGDGVDTLAGVVDCDFPGDVGILLFNTDARTSFTFTHGMRIAQLVLEKVAIITPEEVNAFDETVDRDAAGFGSTGTA